jgi:outer membrane protein TolC
MKYAVLFLLLLAAAATAAAQTDSLVLPEPRTLDLPSLISEALEHNPTIRAADEQMKTLEAHVPQTGALDPPELTYMREDMPGFAFDQARYSRLELMQMIPFPGKLSVERRIGELQADHAHHDHLEVINEVVAQLSGAYVELWFLQQRIVLEGENARLMRQVADVSGARYAAGLVPQSDVLKAQMELAMIGNSILSLRQQELAAKEMMMSILDRPRADTLGYAVISDALPEILPLDSLEQLAMAQRPMVVHDSMMVTEAQVMQSMAQKAYLPDFRIGLEYMTQPLDNMNSWSFRVGMTLPFAPWTLGKTQSQSEEAEARLRKSAASYASTRNMVLADVRTRYLEAASERAQLRSFQSVLVPQAHQTLESVLNAYQNGRAEFMMVLDSYRTVTTVTVDYFMNRMKFEQSLVALQRAVGTRAVSELNDGEVQP